MLAAAAPRPMSRFPSPFPRRGDVSARAASSLGDAEGAGWELGGSPRVPPHRLHQLEKEPLGLVALQSLHVWDGCVIPAASPGLWLLSFGVKFKNNNNFGPFPLTQCPRRCLCVLAIVHPWSFSWCWHLPIYPGTSSLLLTFAFAAL